MRFRRPVIVALHLALVPAAYALAFLLRFEGALPSPYLDLFLVTAPALVVIRLGSYGLYRLFSGWWRHVGFYDLVALTKATSLSSLLFAGYLLAVGHFPGYPRSVLVMDWALALLVFGGIRFGVRWFRERGPGRGWELAGRRTLIIGAGDAGAHLLRQLRQEDSGAIEPVGLVDDDPNKRGIQVHGVPVVGPTDELERLVTDFDVSLLVFAIPTAGRELRQRIARQCAGLNVEFQVVPSLESLIGGEARLTQLETVEPEDLLGRSPVRLDLEQVEADLAGSVVLITGAAGSIGEELARQVAGYRPSGLVLVERAETPLYFARHELASRYPELKLVAAVADVTEPKGLGRLFARYRPDVVLHAAAYKHVPMMEENVGEAVRNNVFGTARTAECASRYGAAKFVLISTDKAVRPSSVMGATKRIAERIVRETPELVASRTDYRAVRFGNVLGSSGSVLPLFRRQIDAGGPVTVTHPEVSRYFMTIPEAVQLVLQAAALPAAADRIALLEMGSPVRILEMAENLIRLSGLDPYTGMPIVFTGLRPGEKLEEELVAESEVTVPTPIAKVRVVEEESRGGDDLPALLDRLSEALDVLDEDRMIRLLCDLAPECVPPLSERGRRAGARLALRPRRLDPTPRTPQREPTAPEPAPEPLRLEERGFG